MVLTDFMTKGPDGEPSSALKNTRFKMVFNILGELPETVGAFLVPRMLANTKNNAHINFLTNSKAAWRFMTAPLRRRELL
jgi:hypothetical protein